MSTKKLNPTTLYIPENWNTKSDTFRNFIIENFLNYCSSSSNKGLNKKAKKIREAPHPEEQLVKEYEKLKYRLWYFFHYLFEENLNDDHKNTWFEEIRTEAFGLSKKTFKPIYSQFIKDILGYRLKSFFMEYLESENLIIIDHQYIPAEYAFSNNAKPKSYRLSHYSYSEDVKIISKEVYIPIREYERLYKTRKSKRKKREEYIDKLESHFKEWTINPNLLSVLKDDNETPQDTREEFIQKYTVHESGFWLKLNTSFGKRVYHKNLKFDKRLRKYLDHKSMFGNLNNKKCIVEHRNCMIYLFCCELIKYNLEDNKKKVHLDLLEKLEFNKSFRLNNRSILVKAFVKLIYEGYKEPLITILSREFELNKIEIKKLKDIIYCGAQKGTTQKNDSDIWTLLMLSKLGIIYDVLKKLFDLEYPKLIDLNGFKVKFISYLNCEVKKIPHISIVKQLSEFFDNYFPNFHSNLNYEKRNDHKAISFRSFRSESKLMIEHVAKKLINEHDIPFLTIHDGILCYEKDASFIKKLVEQKSKLLFGITSPIDIEPIS